MNARAQGRRAVRALTTALALGGVALTGGFGAAAYTGIRSANAAGQHQPAASQPSASPQPHESSSASSSSGSGVSTGTGPSQTSSSGS